MTDWFLTPARAPDLGAARELLSGAEVGRGGVPREVAESGEFTRICPECAVAMALSLEGGSR